jgi:hypothetical protein
MTEAGMRAQLANDHAPETCRMNTVRNLDAWYDAFDVVPGPAAVRRAGGARAHLVTTTEHCHASHCLRAAARDRRLAAAWADLAEHTLVHASQLVLLPEFAMVEPIWESRPFDVDRWNAIER